jgi:hypothetical protein
VLFSAVVLALLLPTVAQGAYTRDGAYFAHPGEINSVTIWYDEAEAAIKIHDPGAGPSSYNLDVGCAFDGIALFTCPGWHSVSAALGDGDDVAIVTEALPFPQPQEGPWGSVWLAGGDGNDFLDAGPGHPFGGKVCTCSNDLFTYPSAGLVGDWPPFGHPQPPPHGPQLSPPAEPDPGNDVLIGGAGQDRFYGGPGDDVMFGKDGRDAFDGEAFHGDISLWRPEAGADAIYGGLGSDTFNGIESEGENAPDTIHCGEGGEGPLMWGYLPGSEIEGDAAGIGAGDSVNRECEGVAFELECPEAAESPCVGSAFVSGNDPGGRTAAAAASRAGRKQRLSLGRGEFRIPPGRRGGVLVVLKRKRVNRVLAKRKAARLRQTVRARSGKKRLKLRGKRFVIRRG